MLEGSHDVDIDGLIAIGQANVGFGFSGGSTGRLANSLVVTPQSATSNQGGYAWQGSRIDFGENVRLYGAKPDGSTAAFWAPNDDGTVFTGYAGVVRGNSNSPEAAAELAAVVRP